MHIFAAFAQGDDGDAAAGFKRAHRVRPGPARPQAHHHDADIRQAAALGAGLRLPQGADLGRLLLRLRSLPKGHKEHLTIEELTRKVCYAPKRINVIP